MSLVYVPTRLFLRRHIAGVVKCSYCDSGAVHDVELPDIEQYLCYAEIPTPMIPHSFCSSGLLAHIVHGKYCNALLLYRLEKDFSAKGARECQIKVCNFTHWQL